MSLNPFFFPYYTILVPSSAPPQTLLHKPANESPDLPSHSFLKNYLHHHPYSPEDMVKQKKWFEALKKFLEDSFGEIHTEETREGLEGLISDVEQRIASQVPSLYTISEEGGSNSE